MMNLSPVYQRWREETLQEGRQEGRQEEIKTLLEAKFGELDTALQQVIPVLLSLSPLERSRLILRSSKTELLAYFENRSPQPFNEPH